MNNETVFIVVCSSWQNACREMRKAIQYLERINFNCYKASKYEIHFYNRKVIYLSKNSIPSFEGIQNLGGFRFSEAFDMDELGVDEYEEIYSVLENAQKRTRTGGFFI